MSQYVNKSVIVAEIEKQRNAYICEPSKYKVLSRILSFIDSLEVKEVDLEKEATEIVQSKEFVEGKESPILLIAKHFFELGLKAKKGE